MIDGGGCVIRLEYADILSNLQSKVSHLEPSQQCKNPNAVYLIVVVVMIIARVMNVALPM